MSEENKRVVLQFIEAMGTNNAELGAACLAPDACAMPRATASSPAGARPTR